MVFNDSARSAEARLDGWDQTGLGCVSAGMWQGVDLEGLKR